MAKIEFQRRHFQFVADTIKDLDLKGFNEEQIKDIANHFAKELKSTNSNFMQGRFLSACGVE